MSYSYENLPYAAKERYLAKLLAIGLANKCPFQLPADLWKCQEMDGWPDLEYGDIFIYLTTTAGVHTYKEMRAYKSLDAHRYFRAGFVGPISHYITPNKSVIFKADVKASQRANDHHSPWVATDKDGVVLAGHCTCMAGLGETCSHVAAVLYKIEAAVKIGLNHTPGTSKPCEWNDFSSSSNKVQAAPIKDIKFYKDESVSKIVTNRKRRSTCNLSGSSPDSQQKFLKSLSTCNTKPVALSLFGETADTFKSNRTIKPSTSLPKPLRSYFSVENRTMTPDELHQKCQDVANDYNISAEQIHYLETQTKAQAQSVVWHQQRPGHITASYAHTILHTSQTNPASSVLLGVTKSTTTQINAAPLNYGRDMENVVFEAHKKFVCTHHTNGTLQKVGMFVDIQRPWLSATADGIITCTCHGRRVLEIKCPYSARDTTAKELLADRTSYIHKGVLKYGHKYYVQVQIQMHVYGVTTCDFVVKAKDRNILIVVHRGDGFLSDTLPKLGEFWKQHIIQELLTRQLEMSKEEPAAGPVSMYCYCQQPEDDGKRLVGCDGVACPFQWIHLECIRPKRKTVPKGKWYCKEYKPKK